MEEMNMPNEIAKEFTMDEMIEVLKHYPTLNDIVKTFHRKLLLLTIAGEDEDNPFESDDLFSQTIEDLHYEYDQALPDDISVEERFRLHRKLEKCIHDDTGCIEDYWFTDTYNYPPESDEDFWDRLSKDNTDPFYGVKIDQVEI